MSRSTLPIHPRRSQVHHTTIGERLADQAVQMMGSWRFIIFQTVAVLVWIGLNTVEIVFRPWDPYPFILLNLGFSTQAAYAAPLLLMAGNRQAARDRRRDDLEAAEVDELHGMMADVHTITVGQRNLSQDVRDMATSLGVHLDPQGEPHETIRT